MIALQLMLFNTQIYALGKSTTILQETKFEGPPIINRRDLYSCIADNIEKVRRVVCFFLQWTVRLGYLEQIGHLS